MKSLQNSIALRRRLPCAFSQPHYAVGRAPSVTAAWASKRWCTTATSHGAEERSSVGSAASSSASGKKVNPSSGGLASRGEEAALMQRMHMTMQRDPNAVRIHRELLLCLAKGDSDGASDLAGLLAKRIGSATDAESTKEKSGMSSSTVEGKESVMRTDSNSADTKESEKIPYTLSSLGDVTDKLSSALSANAKDTAANGTAAVTSPSLNLTITIIDSNFEVEAEECASDVSGHKSAKADEKAMKVLSQYLEADSGAWRDQKRAVAKAVLDAAKQTGITSDALLQSDVASGAGISPSFNPFSECNVIVRCEVPPPSSEESAASVEEQLAEMRGLPDWDEASEALAKKELEMGLVSMRYKVGLHYSIEAALGPQRCAKFVSAAMRLLNEPMHASDTYSHLTIPAMPYTYMMRLCLWMEDPAATEESSP